eukprot:m.413796 g.413796  ORF g.413796 m.413796 type:complete len:204 (+) comp16823_c0_seq27:3213-3824(+)
MIREDLFVDDTWLGVPSTNHVQVGSPSLLGNEEILPCWESKLLEPSITSLFRDVRRSSLPRTPPIDFSGGRSTSPTTISVTLLPPFHPFHHPMGVSFGCWQFCTLFANHRCDLIAEWRPLVALAAPNRGVGRSTGIPQCTHTDMRLEVQPNLRRGNRTVRNPLCFESSPQCVKLGYWIQQRICAWCLGNSGSISPISLCLVCF